MLDSIIAIIEKAEKITILPHIFADGDCLGSSFALAMALKRMGKKVEVYLEEEIPQMYEFLPGKEISSVYRGERIEPGLAIAIDTGDVERLGSRYGIFKAAEITVNIDHHSTNTMFGFYNYVDRNSSASAEIIYRMLKMMDTGLDEKIAVLLYVAIITDTGGFRYSNTTPQTHIIAGDLLNFGINVAEISAKVFDRTSLAKVRLMGEAIQSLEILENGKISVITITDEMISRVQAKEEDCDGLVNLARNIEGVEAAIMLRHRGKDEIKVNFRSNGNIDVSRIAIMFSGGGHPKAAGCTIRGDLEKVKEMVLAKIKASLIANLQ
ncbi:MAG TPA: bifunctional oligoribonuclease/PAP phosphatase NrnA [Clostridiaceae bacterium]|jgi:phosphoesterase RecJ-like protein|nr:bifunctional oligoribonuclease/PAP phosphatase NrnA [Clostridiaceae bacterium]